MFDNPYKKIVDWCGSSLVYSASVSFLLIGKRDEVNPEDVYLGNLLGEYGKGFRDTTRNKKIIATISRPKSNDKTRLLGITYFDKKDNCQNEDLFEISKKGIIDMKKREAEKKYPEYKGYHRNTKEIL